MLYIRKAMDSIMRISQRCQRVTGSLTLAIDAKAKEMKQKGIDVVGFGAGEPDFDTPEHIRKAAKDALDLGKTRYTPAAGMPELRQAICDKLKRDNGLDYVPQQIVVSNGAKHSLFNSFQALLEEGDEVIVPGPYWVSYPEIVRMAGGVPVIVEGREENNFKPTIDDFRAAVTDKTRAVVINSPNNPNGFVFTREELQAIGDLAIEKDLSIVSDEIYEFLVYDGAEHISIASLSPEIKERTIVINGFSKTYAMTGWRMGYAAGPKEIISPMTKLHQYGIMSAPTMSQYAAIEALKNGDDDIAEMRDQYDMRRRLIVDGLNRLGLTCFEPEGAFYVFPSIQSTGMTSDEFCERLIYDKHVAVVPGSAFGACGEGFVRISYAYSIKHLAEALNRIGAFLKELK